MDISISHPFSLCWINRFYCAFFRHILGLGIAALFSIKCNAADPALSLIRGEAVQGGLMVFQLSQGITVTLDGTSIPVTPAGFFVIGFHRDDVDPITLTLTSIAGKTHKHIVTPRLRDYDVQRINGLNRNQVTPPEDTIARIRQDIKTVKNARATLSFFSDAIDNGFSWPSPGRITGVYGSQRILNGEPRQPHYGIDIAAAEGTPVSASADGIVTMATDLYFTGGTIIIDHGYSLNSTYSHLKNLKVSEGQTLHRGQVIGTVGSTGRSTGPHLDWRINWGKKRLDPMLLADPYQPSVPAPRPTR